MAASGQGSVLALFRAVKGEEGRLPADSIDVEKAGIVGDKYFGKNPNRSILLTSRSSYEMARDAGIDIPFGSLGENIVVDIDLYHLGAGDRVRLGDAVLEITQNCTLCGSLGKVHDTLPELLRNDRGIFAKTLEAGRIEIESRVSIVKS